MEPAGVEPRGPATSRVEHPLEHPLPSEAGAGVSGVGEGTVTLTLPPGLAGVLLPGCTVLRQDTGAFCHEAGGSAIPRDAERGGPCGTTGGERTVGRCLHGLSP